MMTQEKLQELGRIVEEKRRAYESIAASNVWGKSIDERVTQEINYRIAQNEYGQAQADYYNAFTNFALANSQGIQQQNA